MVHYIAGLEHVILNALVSRNRQVSPMAAASAVRPWRAANTAGTTGSRGALLKKVALPSIVHIHKTGNQYRHARFRHRRPEDPALSVATDPYWHADPYWRAGPMQPWRLKLLLPVTANLGG